ncbi:MAG TPA: PAS domain-containing protein, partial [Candidatus Aminicenantes bacterium]|nr:PAS domain-containing protein [Candidatus Aminicenantes bacterium]
MIGTIIDLLMNLTLLVTVSIVSGFIRKRWERGWRGVLPQGFLFGCGAVLAMMRPLVFSQGVIFDGRSVMISICAFFFGPVATGIACLLTTAARVIQGGGGALTGVLVICSSALLGLGFRGWGRRRRAEPTVRTFLALGLTVHMAMLALMLTLPGGVWLEVLRRIGLPVLLIFPLATLLIGEILVNHIASLRAVESLRQTKDTLARFIRHSPIYAFIKDVTPTTSRVLYASENYIDMIGISGHDMIGKTMPELFPAEFAAKITADDWRVASSGEVLRLDETLNGRSYTTIKFPIHSGERALLAGYTIDVTERTQAATMLAEKEVRLRTLVQSIPDMVWLKDVEGVYLLCNPMFERYFGAPEAEIIGKTDYDFVDREQADQFRANDRRAMDAGQPIRNEETITCASDGHQSVLETTKAPLVDERGRLVGVLGIGHDISERKRLEEERRQLEAQLQNAQRMESIGVLAGGVAHDMNNVLGAIMGLASANLESQPVGSPAHRAFDTIIKACERGGKMVRGLLNFSRQSLAEERELDLNTILREEASLLERTTLAKVHLEMDLASELRPIRGDANALAHAFMN